MLRKFYKMHGIGNDYIYFDCLDTPLENPEAAALKLSDRHFGIGGDGIVLICPSALADAKMRMFNADGSEGKMCGNAIRCLGKYLYDFQKTNKTTLKIETLSGVKTLFLNVENGKTQSVKVDMGRAFAFARTNPRPAGRQGGRRSGNGDCRGQVCDHLRFHGQSALRGVRRRPRGDRD